MRVTLVTAWYPHAADPVEGVFVARHAAALGLDHDVRVLHLSSRPVPAHDPAHDPARDPRVRHVHLDRRSPASLARAQREVRAALRGADVLHTQVFPTLLALLPLRPRPAVPWVHTEHWSGVSDPASAGPVWHRLAGLRRALDRPDAVVAVSGYLADAVRPFRRDGRVAVVGNVVPAPPLVPPAPEPGPVLRLLAVGNLRPVKDPLLAVEVVAELVRRGRDARLRWVGGGPLEAAVRERAAALGVTGRVELLGRRAPEEFAGEWAACDVFLLPSRHETFGVAGAEALAHGRPAVLGARGGAADLAGPGAHLVASRAVADWADAVQAAAAHPPDPALVAARVRARSSPAAVAAGFAAVHRDLGL
ncbi:glycosyltransferase [Kineococcus terrestris]|uniref:glycosyltransferase n=1 Tax=Kineococcus terrestris TaxID=2044856 RepID=UPI0034DB4D5A